MKKEIKKPRIAIYQTLGDEQKISVRIEDENVWLTQKLIAELFDVDVRTVNEHLKNIFLEQELAENSVIRNFRITAVDGKDYDTKHYDLDAILAVGYRVRSQQGTQFRKWATERLREYLIKGFTLDDERLKQAGGRARYFQELLQRVRDIRSSERLFYQKVTDIYATSIDYKQDAKLTRKFFATVQNKMHFAVHGHTAAEIINKRADSKKPLMGLMSFKSDYITTDDIVIAKNYLNENELNQLNLIVSLYIDFAELQASSGRLMKMQDWIKKLDEFLTISEKQLLHSAGRVSAKQAEKKALVEYEIYRRDRDANYISDFDREIKKLMKKGKK
ncbi:cell filamentation protein Fic [Candidatus Roizmanbacteria bacterium RIFCSPHIGHO2_01_FULL_35_10]|uniref:Cell filamentation protein Fic n=1 Tax=Candidatus Roizmanbacteria bacterium RIFCSPLOWO2_01_FULL_35_13 TaxID=1802055 RepID=A0A1F7IAZ9_9BACT|nr:MAG: cell filamentation protein Fic [Candidatus Roizmanbacteria bacterium RIFCSPHIGHO2_01_FULL_35_10]OGK40534.1 MAG: cell filamentation protein Fic [Candidatus Roizmanbacteria bacterium RIFCSPLOWO2_01_FULL_35_13]